MWASGGRDIVLIMCFGHANMAVKQSALSPRSYPLHSAGLEASILPLSITASVNSSCSSNLAYFSVITALPCRRRLVGGGGVCVHAFQANLKRVSKILDPPPASPS